VTVVVPATITGALLLCDAWINVIPTHAAAQAEGSRWLSSRCRWPRAGAARLTGRDGPERWEKITVVATYPDSTKTSLEQRLRARARERWPQIASLQIRHHGMFSYVDATLTDAATLKLCRLRYVGSASQWQFAIYRASHDDYDKSVFFTGLPVGTCQDALDTACGLYLNDPTAWR
jgi:hypothetical protein